MVLQPPIVWASESAFPITIIGDWTMTSCDVKASFLIEESGFAILGVRIQYAGQNTDTYKLGYFLFINETGAWNFSVGYKILESGKIPMSAGTWHSFELLANGTSITGWIDGKNLFTAIDSTYSNGWVSVGSDWNFVQFDNFSLQAFYQDCGNGDYVKVARCNINSTNQLWAFNNDGTISSNSTPGTCLQVNGTDPNTGKPSVRIMPCNSKLQSQQWTTNGSYILTAVQNMCLDITDQNKNQCAAVEVYTCNQGTNQQWTYSQGLIITQLDGLCLTAAAQ